MTNKKHKGSQPKKTGGPTQSKPPPQNTESNKGYLKRMWTIVSIISILLNFWLAYLVLIPKTTIEYAADLIPDNPIALPIKFSNFGLLSIRNVYIEIEDHNIKTVGNNFLSGNRTHDKLSDNLLPNRSIEYVYNSIVIRDKPISGSVSITITYQLPLLPKVFSQSQSYKLFLSKDGYIRWQTIQ